MKKKDFLTIYLKNELSDINCIAISVYAFDEVLNVFREPNEINNRSISAFVLDNTNSKLNHSFINFLFDLNKEDQNDICLIDSTLDLYKKALSEFKSKNRPKKLFRYISVGKNWISYLDVNDTVNQIMFFKKELIHSYYYSKDAKNTFADSFLLTIITNNNITLHHFFSSYEEGEIYLKMLQDG